MRAHVNSKNDDIYLTTNQAAKVLNVSLSTLKKFIYQGKIKTLKTPGGHHRILKRDLFASSDTSVPTGSPETALSEKTVHEISKGFVAALEKRQRFCRGHAGSVADISLSIARALKLSDPEIKKLHVAALLHDIGMLNIKETILNREGPLPEADYCIMKTHPLLGEDFVSSIEQLAGCSGIIRQHHERFDGRGYPDGLSKDEICLEAKVIALAEAFDSMTSRDSYKKPMSSEKAREEIAKNAGRQFDPQVVEVFLGCEAKGHPTRD